MFSQVKKDLEQGVEKLKWFSSLLSERVRIELEVFKLLYKSEEMKKQKDDLLKSIGEEVYEHRGQNRNIYARSEIIAAIKEIEKLEPEIKESLEKASAISKIIS
ncbi:MAG: hypothetical protein EPN22_10200 [Nitrospirae bacterium]|nr:MAG: hypothetical protein EPN22_10200 [Nitrospirota bacterium]